MLGIDKTVGPWKQIDVAAGVRASCAASGWSEDGGGSIPAMTSASGLGQCWIFEVVDFAAAGWTDWVVIPDGHPIVGRCDQ